MAEIPDKISLKCVFCMSENFEVPEGYEPQYGELIRCANCGRMNDVSSLVAVAHDEVKELATDFVADEVKKMLKKAFK